MYICLNCGDEFLRPKIIEIRHGAEFDLREKRLVSPCCHDSYAAAMNCGSCGTLIAIGKDTRGMCRKCAEKTVARMRYLLFNEFTEAQREVLNDAFDGVALTEPDKAKVILP